MPILAGLVAGALATTAYAQDTGAVRGEVTFAASGEPVHGTVVLVLGPSLVALTEEDGAFEIPDVPAGTYEILAQREHLTAARQTIAVQAGHAVVVDFRLDLTTIHEELTVTATAGGPTTAFEAFNAISTLDSFDLVTNAQGSLGEVLQNQPGVANRSFGPGASRPIIRGFDGDRVLLMEDGIRSGDLSGQSGDHGVTIDPNGLERVEIVRGPATLLYGSNAVGGVVNMITPHERNRESPVPGTHGQIGADTGSANGQAGTNASMQHATGRLSLWAGGGTRRSSDYTTPEGTIENSATGLSNGRAGAGYLGGRLFASGGVQFEDGRHGVPFAGAFHADAGDGATAEQDDEEVRVNLESRRRVGRFVGFEASANVRLVDAVWVNLGLGMVDAELTGTNEPLPLIPPLRGQVSFDISYRGFTIGPEWIVAAAQDHVSRNETETDGYSVFNLTASYVWPMQHMAHILSATGYNLTDELYRSHTSFIKDLAPEIGRGVKLAYSMRFF